MAEKKKTYDELVEENKRLKNIEKQVIIASDILSQLLTLEKEYQYEYTYSNGELEIDGIDSFDIFVTTKSKKITLFNGEYKALGRLITYNKHYPEKKKEITDEDLHCLLSNGEEFKF